jgi:uncharacterized membrane protein
MRFPHLVILHISGGLVGLLAGAAAMTFRKGSGRHALAGDVFVIAMAAMAGTGAFMGFWNHLALVPRQLGNVFNGILTLYLVLTGWMTARRGDGKTGTFDWLAFLAAFAVGTGMMVCGFKALNDPTGSIDGYPAGIYLFFGSVALLSGAGDIRMLVRGEIAGTQRIVRHLWRMSFALLIAAFSFFLGQQVFPASWRGAPVWYVPPVAVLVFMIFWLVRARFASPRRPNSFAHDPATH